MRFVPIFKEKDKRLPVVFGGTDNQFETAFKDVQVATERPDVEYYKGDYEVTPKREAQIIPTGGKMLTEDITVKAIPPEYGLVSYDNRKIITIT